MASSSKETVDIMVLLEALVWVSQSRQSTEEAASISSKSVVGLNVSGWHIHLHSEVSVTLNNKGGWS